LQATFHAKGAAAFHLSPSLDTRARRPAKLLAALNAIKKAAGELLEGELRTSRRHKVEGVKCH
jgi:hypothetical protein